MMAPELSRRAGRAFNTRRIMLDMSLDEQDKLRAALERAGTWDKLAKWAKDVILEAEREIAERAAQQGG